jgi:hypothetical protein
MAPPTRTHALRILSAVVGAAAGVIASPFKMR